MHPTNAYQPPGAETSHTPGGDTTQRLLLLLNALSFGSFCAAWAIGLALYGWELAAPLDDIPSVLLDVGDATAPWTGFGHYVCAVTFALFSYRASQNARALGRTLQYSAPETIYWHFVPLANYVMPYHVMRNLWRASASSDSGGAYMLIWWVCYVLYRVASVVSHFTVLPITDPDYDHAAILHDFAIGVPALISASLAFYLLYDIHRRQTALANGTS